MDLLSGYSDNALMGFNGYTPQANAGIANNNNEYLRNQLATAMMGQQQIDRNTAAIAATGPSSGYGMVGGYPTFGDPAPAGTYSPGSGRSSFSGQPLQQSMPDISSGDSYEPEWLRAYRQNFGAEPDGSALSGLTRVNVGQSPYVYSDPYSHMGVFPGQPRSEDWQTTFSQMTAPARQADPYEGGGGYDYNDPATYGGNGASMRTPQMPDMQRLLGYNPNAALQPAPSTYGADPYNTYGQPGAGAGGYGVPGGSDVPEWLRAYRQNFGREPDGQALSGGLMASGGDTSYLGAGGPNNAYNPFGQINSGQVGQYDPFGGSVRSLPGNNYSNPTVYEDPYGGLARGGWDMNMGYGSFFNTDTPNGRADMEAFYRNNGQQGVIDPMGSSMTAPGAIQGTGGPSFNDATQAWVNANRTGMNQNFNALMSNRFSGTGMPAMQDISPAAQQQAINPLQDLQKQLEYFLNDPRGQYNPHTAPTVPNTLEPQDFTAGGSKGA